MVANKENENNENSAVSSGGAEESLEGEKRFRNVKTPPSQQVSVYRMRFSVRADAVIKGVMAGSGWKYPRAANHAIEQFDRVERWEDAQTERLFAEAVKLGVLHKLRKKLEG